MQILLGFNIASLNTEQGSLCMINHYLLVHIGNLYHFGFIFCSLAGNFYNHLVKDSVDAANLLGNDLTSAVKDIQALHRPFFDSSLPAVMQDMFINSLSHIRYLLIMRS